MPSRSLADWQLPPGVNRGLWDYVQDPGIAANYDASLSGSSLFHLDVAFVEQHCSGPARLIDLGCGTGRLLLHLAARGWSVLGVDLSAEMLRVARRRAEQAGRRVDLLQANLVELQGLADQSFDHAACLFSTLGMVVGQSARQAVLGHAYRVLRPGGRLILHVHNRWFHLWDSPGRRWLLADQLRRCWGDPQAGDRTMPVHQGIAHLVLHLFDKGEVVQLLRQAGFRLVEVRPISLAEDGQLCCSWLVPNWRAYGFLLAAERPQEKVAASGHSAQRGAQ